MHQPMLLIDGAHCAESKVAASESDGSRRHRRSIKPGKTMFPKLTVFRNPCGNQRMRDLHEHCSRCREGASHLTVHPPEHRFRGEEWLRHAYIFSQVGIGDNRPEVNNEEDTNSSVRKKFGSDALR